MRYPPVTALYAAALLLGVLGVAAVGGAVYALRQRRAILFGLGVLGGVALVAGAALAGIVAAGSKGWLALTGIERAATVVLAPAGAQRWQASIRLADGRELATALAGDEVVVDAQLLAPTARGQALGLRPLYRLVRIGGRYRDAVRDLTAPRTALALAVEAPIDLPALSRPGGWFAPWVEARELSAAFAAGRAAAFELRVSSDGALRAVPR